MDAFNDSTIDPGGGVTAELLDDLAEMVADLPGDRQIQLLDDLARIHPDASQRTKRTTAKTARKTRPNARRTTNQR